MAFTCMSCGSEFSLPEAVLAKYPGWAPKKCMSCRDGSTGKPGASRRPPQSVTATTVLSPEEVLARYHDGPKTGLFTDGGAMPNPGPGGWGVAWVENDVLRAERHGHDPDTTNNRMELTALWEGLKLVPRGTPVVVHADSELVVNTFTKWAASWKRNGWKRKGGPLKNLDLVQPIHEELVLRSEVTLQWVPAHSGWRWNEYADALASLWTRAEKGA